MVRFAIGLIFVGNGDGHVLESYCTGILNLVDLLDLMHV